MDAKQGDLAMTTTQIRARYGRIYALAITMLAVIAVAGSVWAGNTPAPAMDISAIMIGVDMTTLPVHTITDAI
jgi:hypothetical protein